MELSEVLLALGDSKGAEEAASEGLNASKEVWNSTIDSLHILRLRSQLFENDAVLKSSILEAAENASAWSTELSILVSRIAVTNDYRFAVDVLVRTNSASIPEVQAYIECLNPDEDISVQRIVSKLTQPGVPLRASLIALNSLAVRGLRAQAIELARSLGYHFDISEETDFQDIIAIHARLLYESGMYDEVDELVERFDAEDIPLRIGLTTLEARMRAGDHGVQVPLLCRFLQGFNARQVALRSDPVHFAAVAA